MTITPTAAIEAEPSGPGGRVTVLDGGMGQELVRRGAAGDGLLWSAYPLVHAPEVVRRIHDDFIAAGADVITTNSYAATEHRLAVERSSDRFAELNDRAGMLARQAARHADRRVRVAASLPPQHGGYRVAPGVSEATLIAQYRRQAEVLAPYADLMLCETVASIAEARAAVRGAATTGRPVWVALTLRDGGSTRLRSGESLGTAVQALLELPVAAILVNCCAPESVTAALAELPTLTQLPVGGYANGFTHIPDGWTFGDDQSIPDAHHDLGPTRYGAVVANWVRSGASIVGGCCEIGPEHIAEVSRTLASDFVHPDDG